MSLLLTIKNKMVKEDYVLFREFTLKLLLHSYSKEMFLFIKDWTVTGMTRSFL